MTELLRSVMQIVTFLVLWAVTNALEEPAVSILKIRIWKKYYDLKPYGDYMLDSQLYMDEAAVICCSPVGPMLESQEYTFSM
jgi:hypothetical protein